jgi:hypothetical protein
MILKQSQTKIVHIKQKSSKVLQISTPEEVLGDSKDMLEDPMGSRINFLE